MKSSDHRRESINELRSIFDELSETDRSAPKRVSEAIARVESKRYLTDDGALSDTLAPKDAKDADPEARRQAQVLAATLPDSGQLDHGRRRALKFILGAPVTIATGALGGLLAAESHQLLHQPDTYDESFIRTILLRHSDRPTLWSWREQLLEAGKTREAELISVLSVHGEGFSDAFVAITRLRELIDDARLSQFSRTYLELNYCTHHRYLGLNQQALKLFEEIDSFETNDPRLNVLLLNQRHMTHYQAIYPSSDFSQQLANDNEALSRSISEKLRIEASSIYESSFREAGEISVECVALKGIYLMNLCMAANSESEALDAMNLLDQYRRQVVSTLILPEVDAGRDWMAVRLYGEAVWNYGRVAPVALCRGWDQVLRRCIEAFYDVGTAASPQERTVMERFHEAERRELRSPIWIQMALVRSMFDEISSGSGDQTAHELLPESTRYKIKRHSPLQRTFDAMSLAFGRDPANISKLNALVAVESSLLLDCVSEMLRRRGSPLVIG